MLSRWTAARAAGRVWAQKKEATRGEPRARAISTAAAVRRMTRTGAAREGATPVFGTDWTVDRLPARSLLRLLGAGYYAASTSPRARALTPDGSSTARVHAPSAVRRRPWWSWNSAIAFHAHHFEPGALPTVSPSRNTAITASRARRRLVSARPPSAVSWG